MKKIKSKIRKTKLKVKQKFRKNSVNSESHDVSNTLKKLINEYVVIKNYNVNYPIPLGKNQTIYDLSNLIVTGILKLNDPGDSFYEYVWIVQFNPLIQGKITKDLGILTELGLDDAVTQDFMFQNFEENYPPTFQFTFNILDVYDVVKNTIYLWDFKFENKFKEIV